MKTQLPISVITFFNLCSNSSIGIQTDIAKHGHEIIIDVVVKNNDTLHLYFCGRSDFHTSISFRELKDRFSSLDEILKYYVDYCYLYFINTEE